MVKNGFAKTLGAATLAATCLITGTSAFAQTETAQSAMINLSLNGSFVIIGADTWRYNRDVPVADGALVDPAVSFFDNAHNGTVTYLGCSPANRCAGQPVPPAPAAPPPLPQPLQDVVTLNKCTFWVGGVLTGDTYFRDVSLQQGSGQTVRNYRYRYWYDVVPNTNPVTAMTAWALISSDSSPAVATLNGFIASQQTVAKTSKGKGQFSFKTAHNIVGPSGDLQITDFAVSLVSDGVVTPIDVILIPQTGVPLFYQRTPGAANGATTQLIDGWDVDDIQNGQTPAGTPVAGPAPTFYRDDFLGNDFTLGHRAEFVPVELEFAIPGLYTLSVSGTVKGVQGAANIPFDVTRVVDVDAEDCSLAEPPAP